MHTRVLLHYCNLQRTVKGLARLPRLLHQNVQWHLYAFASVAALDVLVQSSDFLAVLLIHYADLHVQHLQQVFTS